MKQLFIQKIKNGICLKSFLVFVWFAIIRWVWMLFLPLNGSIWANSPLTGCILAAIIGYTFLATFEGLVSKNYKLKNQWWTQDLTNILLWFNIAILMIQMYSFLINPSVIDVLYLILDVLFIQYFKFMKFKIGRVNNG